MLIVSVCHKRGYGSTEIGNFLFRDHSTILHLLKKSKLLQESDALFQKYTQENPIAVINNSNSTFNNKKYGNIYKKFGGKCAICKFDEVVEVHHIIPKSLGGGDEMENLILLCPNHHALADRGMLLINNLKLDNNEVINISK